MNQLSANSPNSAQIQQDTTDFSNNMNSIIGTAANYAQILGTAEGPIAQAAAASALAAEGTAFNNLSAADQAAEAASVGAATGGVGAAIVLIIGFLMAAVSASTTSGSNITQYLENLYSAIKETENIVLDTYWSNTETNITNWYTPVFSDLQDINTEPLTGPNVIGHAYTFHEHSQTFVDNLLLDKSYWTRPYVQSLLFTPQYIGQDGNASFPWRSAWYGDLPRPQPEAGSGTTVAFNVQYSLQIWLFAIQTYLTIHALLNAIPPTPQDPSQPPFNQFVSDQRSYLGQYANFLHGGSDGYHGLVKAIKGLVKSDLPSFEDVLGYIYIYNLFSPFPPPPWIESKSPAIPNSSSSTPKIGYAWNGIYGVVDEYGFYTTPVGGGATPSYIIDGIGNIFEALAGIDLSLPGTVDLLKNSFYPWIRNLVRLRLMARWKALYIINGYGKAWSILQNLRSLAKLPDPDLTLPDGTIANGNWSARELINVLNVSPMKNYQNEETPYPGDNSLNDLVTTLDEIARRDWDGLGAPPYFIIYPGRYSGEWYGRPIGFRDRLAAAAM